MKNSDKITLTFGQLTQLVKEAQAVQAQQQAPQQNAQTNKFQQMFSKALNTFVEPLKKIPDPNAIAEILKAVVNSANIPDAMSKIKAVKAKYDKKAAEEKAQQAQQDQSAENGEAPEEGGEAEVNEGIFDRYKATFSSFGQGAKSAAKNIGNAVKGKVTGKDQGKSDSILGAMQTGKFSSLINSYINKCSSLSKEIKSFIASSKDAEENKKCEAISTQLDEFISAAQQALKDTKEQLKKSGYDRSAKDDEENADKDDTEDKDKNADKPEQDDDEQEETEQVDENTLVSISFGDLTYLVKECKKHPEILNEGFWDKLKQGAKQVGGAIKGAATSMAKTTADVAKDAWNSKDALKQDKRPASVKFSEKVARIIGELNMDLKDMGWSQKQNPQLAKVIDGLQKNMNVIHGKGKEGMTTAWDRTRHRIGKLTQQVVNTAATAVAMNTIFGPLKQFMNPRWHAALVAACTVFLRALMKYLNDVDLRKDKAEEKQATANESRIRSRRLIMEDAALVAAVFNPATVTNAAIKGTEAYIKNNGAVAEEKPKPEAGSMSQGQMQALGKNGFNIHSTETSDLDQFEGTWSRGQGFASIGFEGGSPTYMDASSTGLPGCKGVMFFDSDGDGKLDSVFGNGVDTDFKSYINSITGGGIKGAKLSSRINNMWDINKVSASRVLTTLKTNPAFDLNGEMAKLGDKLTSDAADVARASAQRAGEIAALQAQYSAL